MNNQKNVPFFNYPRAYLDDRENLIKFLMMLGIERFYYAKDLRDFEANLANYTGGLSCSRRANATDGLELAWMANRIKPWGRGKFVALIQCWQLHRHKTAGGTPIPVELGEDGLMILTR